LPDSHVRIYIYTTRFWTFVPCGYTFFPRGLVTRYTSSPFYHTVCGLPLPLAVTYFAWAATIALPLFGWLLLLFPHSTPHTRDITTPHIWLLLPRCCFWIPIPCHTDRIPRLRFYRLVVGLPRLLRSHGCWLVEFTVYVLTRFPVQFIYTLTVAFYVHYTTLVYLHYRC